MLIRSTNTGITGIVSEKGKTITTGDSFTPLILDGQVIPFTGETPYMKWGEGPLFVLIILSFIFGAVYKHTRQSL